MTTQEIIKKAAAELNLPYKKVWEIYQAYWESIREYISSLPLKKCESEEEFSPSRTPLTFFPKGALALEILYTKTAFKDNNESTKLILLLFYGGLLNVISVI